MITVTGPQDIKIQFEDDATEEFIRKTFKDAGHPLPEPGSMSLRDRARDIENTTTRKMLESVVGIPGIPGSALGWVQDRFGEFGEAVGDKIFGGPMTPETKAKVNSVKDAGRAWLPSSTDVVGAFDKATGDLFKYEAKTPEAEVIGNVAGMATPAGMMRAPTAVSKAWNAVKFGVAPAVAAEGAANIPNIKGTQYEGYARIAAALVTGGAAALASRPSTAAQVLARELPNSLSPNDVVRAEQLMRTSRTVGVPLTWPEAIAQATNGRVNINDIQRWVEQSRGGKEVMQPFMANRPPRMAAAHAEQMNDLSAGTQMVPPVEAGLSIQRASTGTINALRQRINAVTDNLYRTASTTRVDPQTMATLLSDPLFRYALDQVRHEPSYSRFINGYVDESVQVLDQVKKFLDAGARPVIGGPNTSAAGYAASARDVRGAASTASPEYAAALARQERLRNAVLLPAEEGQLGKLAATSDISAQGRALLSTNPAAGGAAATAQTVRRLVRTNPDAATQLVRNRLETTFAEQAQARANGPNQFGGANWNAFIRGNPEQARNLEAAVRALPDGNVRWEALQEFMNVLESTRWRLPAGSPTGGHLAIEGRMAQGGLMGEALSTVGSPSKLTSLFKDLYGRYRTGAAAGELATIFTSMDARTLQLFRQLVESRGTPQGALTAAVIFTNATTPLRIPFKSAEEQLAPPQ